MADPVPALLAQAFALLNGRRHAEARALCAQLATMAPALADAPYLAGLSHAMEHRFADALPHLEKAVALAPRRADFRSTLAQALNAAGRRTDAIPHLQAAAEASPDEPAAWLILGAALRAERRWADAEAALRRAHALDPGHMGCRNELALALQPLHRFAEAADILRPAAEQADDPTLWRNLANLERLAHHFDAAREAFRRALARVPDDPDCHADLGVLELTLGNWPEGFAHYDWRWRSPSFPSTPLAGPAWRGEPLDGATVALHAEQGLGDAINFVRYAPMVKARGARTLLVCGRHVAGLLARADGVDEVTTVTPPQGLYRCQAPLMSLPAVFGHGPADVPSAPYLSAAPDRTAAWRTQLGTGPKVGLAWAGNPDNLMDVRRSLPVEALEPLAAVAGPRYFSLMVDRRARCPAFAEDLGPRLGSLDETAAALVALDLVITVDTAVAHLAGALGRPVWLLLAHTPDWRWGLTGDTSPWYPTARLFRQPEPGAWGSVVADVCNSLTKFAETGHAAHRE